MRPSAAPSPRSPFVRFFVAVGLTGFAGTLYATTFNNYINAAFHLTPESRGFLEFPREAPGFLLAMLTAMFFFVGEKYVAAIACLTMTAGMAVLAGYGAAWTPMLAGLVVWSVGEHLIMPMRSSLAMGLATPETRGRRLGQTQAAGLGAGLLACLVVWVVMDRVPGDFTMGEHGIPGGYAVLYLIGGAACAMAAILFVGLRPAAHSARRPPLVVRRYMWLYYTLALLFGARKQTFITFGPWVLIQVFHQPVTIIATLWMTGSLLGLVTQPFLGRMIDRYGERTVLAVDSVLVLLVTVGYGWAHLLGGIGVWVLYVCFVGDQLLFGMEMARETYLSKIARRREDVAPSLSVGVSINHVAAMILPMFAGMLWVRWGHAWVFMAAGGVAVLMGLFSLMIRIPPAAAEAAATTGPGRGAPNARSSVRILAKLAEEAPQSLSVTGAQAGLDNTMLAESALIENEAERKS